MARPVVIVPGFGSSALRPRRGAAAGEGLDWVGSNRTYYDHANRRYFSEIPLEVAGFGRRAGGILDGSPALDGSGWPEVGQGVYEGLALGVEAAGGSPLAAPYDFRASMGPGYEEFRSRLRALVQSRGEPAVVVAHGLGAVLARAALSDWWLAHRRVRALVEVCPAHGGCLSSLEAMKDPRGPRARSARALAGLALTLPNARAFDPGTPVWRDRDGSELFPGVWPWPDVAEPCGSLAGPVLCGAQGIPRTVSHVVLHSGAIDTPVYRDRMAGEDRHEEGDGVVTSAAALCRACDHTEDRRLSCGHREAPSARGTVEAVQQFLL